MVSYPVTINSPPSDILQAFKDSGYYQQLANIKTSDGRTTYQKLAEEDNKHWIIAGVVAAIGVAAAMILKVSKTWQK